MNERMKTSITDSRIAEFIGKYTPEMAALIMSCRAKLHALVPRGYELVYDNYNALVFAFASSEKASGAILSIAAYPHWVTLFFWRGTSLSDPESLLQGAGSQVRSIVLKAPEDLDKPSVKAIIAQALSPAIDLLQNAPPLQTIIKSVAAKQRPRKPNLVVPKSTRTRKRINECT